MFYVCMKNWSFNICVLFYMYILKFICNIGSELFRRDADAEQRLSSVRDDLTKAKQFLCSVTDKVTLFYIFKTM
jgi:hypothetical protein